MSFQASDLAKWRLLHRNALVQIGLPSFIANSDRKFNYVLLHGDDELDTGWDVSWLSPEDATSLLKYLVTNLEKTSGLDLVSRLEAITDNRA